MGGDLSRRIVLPRYSPLVVSRCQSIMTPRSRRLLGLSGYWALPDRDHSALSGPRGDPCRPSDRLVSATSESVIRSLNDSLSARPLARAFMTDSELVMALIPSEVRTGTLIRGCKNMTSTIYIGSKITDFIQIFTRLSVKISAFQDYVIRHVTICGADEQGSTPWWRRAFLFLPKCPSSGSIDMHFSADHVVERASGDF